MPKKKRKSGDCQRCGTFREALHRDHIIPKWNGGIDDETNVQYLCANCHEEKTLLEHRSPEFAAFQSECGRKMWADPKMRAKIAERMQGVPKSDQTREAMSRSRKNYCDSPEGKLALAKARAHVIEGWTPEARAAQSERLTERFEDPELRKKCGEQNIGVQWSDERRASHSLRRFGTTQPRKKGFTPLSIEHKAAIVEGKRKRREFLASLSPQALAEFQLNELNSQLARLNIRKKLQDTQRDVI